MLHIVRNLSFWLFRVSIIKCWKYKISFFRTSGRSWTCPIYGKQIFWSIVAISSGNKNQWYRSGMESMKLWIKIFIFLQGLSQMSRGKIPILSHIHIFEEIIARKNLISYAKRDMINVNKHSLFSLVPTNLLESFVYFSLILFWTFHK